MSDTQSLAFLAAVAVAVLGGAFVIFRALKGKTHAPAPRTNPDAYPYPSAYPDATATPARR